MEGNLQIAQRPDSTDRGEGKRLRTVRTPINNIKRGQEPIVRSTLRAIWLLVPDHFFKAKHWRAAKSAESCEFCPDQLPGCKNASRIQKNGRSFIVARVSYAGFRQETHPGPKNTLSLQSVASSPSCFDRMPGPFGTLCMPYRESEVRLVQDRSRAVSLL